MKKNVVSRDPEVMGGTAVFPGTRVPVQTLFDYLEAGDTIDDFLEAFPPVTRNQVIAFLQEAKNRAIESADGGRVEAEARDRLHGALQTGNCVSADTNLYDAIRKIVEPFGGIEIE